MWPWYSNSSKYMAPLAETKAREAGMGQDLILSRQAGCERKGRVSQSPEDVLYEIPCSSLLYLE